MHSMDLFVREVMPAFAIRCSLSVFFGPGQYTVRPERRRPTMAKALKKVRVSMMNAIHDLPLLVARDEGFFRTRTRSRHHQDAGLGQRDSDHPGPPAEHIRAHHGGALRPRPVRQFRMCEWA